MPLFRRIGADGRVRICMGSHRELAEECFERTTTLMYKNHNLKIDRGYVNAVFSKKVLDR